MTASPLAIPHFPALLSALASGDASALPPLADLLEECGWICDGAGVLPWFVRWGEGVRTPASAYATREGAAKALAVALSRCVSALGCKQEIAK